MTSPQKRYIVTVTAWAAYKIELEAGSAEEAERLAEEAYEEDIDRFDQKDGGINDIDVSESKVRS